MPASKTRSLHIALCAAMLAGISWAAPPGPPPQSNRLAVWPRGASSPAFNLVDVQGVTRTLSDGRLRLVGGADSPAADFVHDIIALAAELRG